MGNEALFEQHPVPGLERSIAQLVEAGRPRAESDFVCAFVGALYELKGALHLSGIWTYELLTKEPVQGL